MAQIKHLHRGTSPGKPPEEKPPLLKKQRRYKPGTIALWEIRHYQQTSELQLRKAPFSHLVREITGDMITPPSIMRYSSRAVGALHEASEAYMTTLLEDSNLVTIHSKRVTVMSKDISLIRQIRGETDDINIQQKGNIDQNIDINTGKKIHKNTRKKHK